MKKFERDARVGSLDMDFLSRYSGLVGGMALTGHRQRVVSIPCNSMEEGLQKHVKKFERDPTVGSFDTDIFSRYSGPFSGKALTGRRGRVVRSP